MRWLVSPRAKLRKKKERQFEAYIEALEPKLKRYHHDLLGYLGTEIAKGWSKQELMDQAQRQIALDDTVRARVAELSEAELSSLSWTLPKDFAAILPGPLRYYRQQIEKALESVEIKRRAST